jgi:hypothetical protein
MAIENDAPASGGDDLRSELERAFANPSPEPAETDLIPDDAAPAPEAAPVEAAPTEPQAEANDTRSRDEKGRFAPKPADLDAKPAEAVPTQAQPKPAEQPKQADYIPPPAAWTDPRLVTKWQNLPKEVRSEIARRESQIGELERGFSGVAQVLAPRAQRLAAAYGSPEQGLNTLFQLSDYAEKDPYGFVSYFMQQRGLDPRRLFQQPSGQQPPQGAAPNDATGLQAELQQLRQTVQALHSQQSTATEKVYSEQIEAFARDPSRPFFNSVRQKMAGLLQTGAATTLEDAYEQAVWADPVIRQELQTKELERLEAERKAKTDAARKAQQANITGSAPVGLTANAQPDSIRGAILDAWNAHGGRV